MCAEAKTVLLDISFRQIARRIQRSPKEGIDKHSRIETHKKECRCKDNNLQLKLLRKQEERMLSGFSIQCQIQTGNSTRWSYISMRFNERDFFLFSM
jgi:phage terminase large subunit-like protein